MLADVCEQDCEKLELTASNTSVAFPKMNNSLEQSRQSVSSSSIAAADSSCSCISAAAA